VARLDTKLILTQRDYLILNEVGRWKYLLARQIKELMAFPSQSACDHRIAKLCKNGFLKGEHILVGIRSLYFLGSKARRISTIKYYSYRVKLDEMSHDIAVVDTVIWFMKTKNLSLDDIRSEKELHSKEGFTGIGGRTHKPDFIFKKGRKTYCVEVELTPKSKARFENNIRDNFTTYDGQYWVVPKRERKVRAMLEEMKKPDTELIDLEVIHEGTFKK